MTEVHQFMMSVPWLAQPGDLSGRAKRASQHIHRQLPGRRLNAVLMQVASEPVCAAGDRDRVVHRGCRCTVSATERDLTNAEVVGDCG